MGQGRIRWIFLIVVGTATILGITASLHWSHILRSVPAQAGDSGSTAVALPPPVNEYGGPVLSGDAALSLLSGGGSRALFGGNPNASGVAPALPTVAPTFPGVSTNVLVNNTAFDVLTSPVNFTQSETSVAVSGKNVVVGFNDSVGPTSFSGFSQSTDGGYTFTEGTSMFGAGRSGDPALAVDSAGVFYYADLDSGTVAGVAQSGVSVTVSTDSGATFTNGSFFGAGNACDFLDKEQISVLRSSSAVNGPQTVVTYTRFVNGQPGCGGVPRISKQLSSTRIPVPSYGDRLWSVAGPVPSRGSTVPVASLWPGKAGVLPTRFCLYDLTTAERRIPRLAEARRW